MLIGQVKSIVSYNLNKWFFLLILIFHICNASSNKTRDRIHRRQSLNNRTLSTGVTATHIIISDRLQYIDFILFHFRVNLWTQVSKWVSRLNQFIESEGTSAELFTFYHRFVYHSLVCFKLGEKLWKYLLEIEDFEIKNFSTVISYGLRYNRSATIVRL